MAYQDPDPRSRDDAHRPASSNFAGATWGWIAGAVVLVLILIFIFENNGTSPNLDSSPAAPANNTAQGPVSPPATTGQGR